MNLSSAMAFKLQASLEIIHEMQVTISTSPFIKHIIIVEFQEMRKAWPPNAL